MKKAPTSLLVILLIVIAFAAFFPSLRNGFTLWDDDLYVTDNPVIMTLSTASVRHILSTFQLGFYHPLTLLSFMAEYHFFRLNPFPYHLTNLILHTLNTILVFLFIVLLCKDRFGAAVTAILFCIHPLHVESVAWIAERKDVLSAFFLLGTLTAYLSYRERSSRSAYILSLVLYLLSFLAKPVGLTAPLLLILCDWLQRRTIDRKSLIDKAPYAVIALVFAAVAFLAEKKVGAINRTGAVTSIDNLLIGCHALIFYIYKSVFPLGLSAVYPPPERIDGHLTFFFFLAPVGVLILAAAVFLARNRARAAAFGSLFYAVSILPVLQIVPITWTIAADRYTYLPLIGLFYLAGAGCSWIYARVSRPTRAAVMIIIALAALSLGSLTRQRCAVWHDSVSLWSDVIRSYPRFALAYMNRGYAFSVRGQFLEAIADYDKAILIDPSDAETLNNRGSAYAAIGARDRAIAEYSASLAIKPANMKALNNRANAYLAAGAYDQAIADYMEALRVEAWHIKDIKNRAKLYNNLGFAHAMKKEYDQAIACYREALKINPMIDEVHINIGNAMLAIGDLRGSLEEYTAAIKINPRSGKAYHNRGYALFLLKDRQRARADIETAQKLKFRVQPELLRDLQMAPEGR